MQNVTASGYDAASHAGGGGLLTTRPYDPSTYNVGQGPVRQDEQTPSKEGGKRKREKQSKDTPPVKPLKTPKRTKLNEESGRAAKRIKVDDGKAQLLLPTPPSTGRELPTTELPNQPHLASTPEEPEVPTITVAEIAAPARKPGVVVTRSQDEGRKLELVRGQSAGVEEQHTPEEKLPSPRTTSIPVLKTDAAGLAQLTTSEILESEMAWLENRASSPSPVPEPAPRTPTMKAESLVDDTDTPATKARKVVKRLQAFSDVKPLEEGIVSTRIDMFGRVAVRKGVALKFLGLDGSAAVYEEISRDEDILARPIASSSKSIMKPNWPDAEAPWALAGGSRKERVIKEDSERTASLRRYLETASDESSDEEETASWYAVPKGKGKGKSVARLLTSAASDTSDRRSQSDWETAATDAKSALLLGLRNRSIPTIPSGVVACVCGERTTTGLGSMIACSACKTWHHLACYNLDTSAAITQPWWCSSCETQAHALALSTPARTTTPRTAGYAQSDERSSAFKGESSHIALAPSPMFPSFSQAAAAARTPLSRAIASASAGSPSRPQRARILSYGADGDIWSSFTEDGASGSTMAPSTPAQNLDRFSTPRIDDAPFDVTSTPSRHIDFNFGQPSLFSLTPLGGRSRITSGMLGMGLMGANAAGLGVGMMYDQTPIPMRGRNVSFGAPLTELGPTRGHEFFKELNKGAGGGMGLNAPHTVSGSGLQSIPMDVPLSPTMSMSTSNRWPHTLMGAHNVSPLAKGLGHRRTLSGNKMSSLRSSSNSFTMGTQGQAQSQSQSGRDAAPGSRAGLGLGMPLETLGGGLREEDEDAEAEANGEDEEV